MAPPTTGTRVQKFVASDSDRDSDVDTSGDDSVPESPPEIRSNVPIKSRKQLSGINDRLDTKPPKTSPVVAKGKSTSRDRLTCLFTMDKLAYDATLKDLTLILSLCEGQAKNARERRRSLSKKNSKSDLLASQTVVIPMCQIYAVNVVRGPQNRTGKRTETVDIPDLSITEGNCMGIMILMFERMKHNSKCEERAVFLRHPSEVICQEWTNKISEKMATFKNRPKKVLFLAHVSCGQKNARRIYHDTVKPLMKVAKVESEVIELDHKEHMKQIITHLDLDEYDCLAVIGGDGTVKELVHHLLCRIQEDSHVEQDPTFVPKACTLPIGIIPAGVSNRIVMTMQGTVDLYTACVHVMLGHRLATDVASIFLKGKFRRWAFNMDYGTLAVAQRYFDKTKNRPAHILDHAFGKALSKKKFRYYDCEVRYVPAAEEAGEPDDEILCRHGCETCDDLQGKDADSDSGSDDVQAFDPLDQSGNSDVLREMKTSTDEEWRTLKGRFCNISLYCNPSLCEQAPQGMSKYTHYSDGTMDLICIRNTERKDFIRFMKRCGCSKDQLDFPFVETFRVKQVEFHQRGNTWQYKEKSGRTGREAKKEEANSDTDSDDEDDDDNDSKNAEESEVEEPKSKAKKGGRHSVFSRHASLLDLNKKSSKQDQKSKVSSRRLSLSVARRQSVPQVETDGAKGDGPLGACWAIDGDLEYESDLNIRVHRRLVTFCGFGIHGDVHLGDCEFHYLPIY